MVDIKLLKGRGISAGCYKVPFTMEPAEQPAKIKKLIELISGRIRDGRNLNLKEWRAIHAIDLAYDVPFNQTTPTLIHHILSQNLSMEQTQEALKNWGLNESELFLKVPTPDGVGLKFNAPVFFNVFIPIVKAYTGARSDKLFNERNKDPLLPYNPLKLTTRNQVLCEIVTDIMRTISNWYGYPAVLDQSIKQSNKYGVMLSFPREEWHCETQLVLDKDGREKKVTVKEGLRYVQPHPTRMFYDLNHPLTSINSDSGVEWLGYWHILPYGDILDNRLYWNRKNIFCGTNWLESPSAGNYFKEVFPCRMPFKGDAGWEHGMTREDKAAIYGTGDRDKAVFVTEYFHKLIPKDWGLGRYEGGKLVSSYDFPVWHRFTVAGDDSVIWCAPCAYTPSWFMGYDYDENTARNASMALECIPWQDHLGNILTQMLLTIKQNLANAIFYDTNIIDKEDIKKLSNSGEQMYRGMTFIPYDSMKTARAGLQIDGAFKPVQLGKQSIVEHLQMIPMVLNIMERVLQVSAQEFGAAASHQQSKFELQQTGGASTSRSAKLGAAIDQGMDAWERQLFDAARAYHDPEIEAQVSADIPDVHKILEDLGFTVKHSDDNTLIVHGNKGSIRLEGFARTNVGMQSYNDKEAAQVIFQTVGTISGQEDLRKKIGAKNLLAMLEFAAKLAGAPDDFKLHIEPDGGEPDEVPENVIEAIKTAQAAVMQTLEEKQLKPIAGEIAQQQQELQSIQAALKQMEGIYQTASALSDKTAAKREDAASKIQLRQQEAQAAEQRKIQAAAVDEQIKQEAAAQEQSRANALTQAEIQRKAALTAADVAAKQSLAEQKKNEAKAAKP